MYHTQIQPLNGKQFVLSSHTITCIKMVPLKTLVISANDLNFKKIHKLIALFPGCMKIIFVCWFNLGIFLLRIWSNCEWDFYDPIHTFKKHAQAHIFSTDFFVLELSALGALCFHFPTGAAYVSPDVGFLPSKIYIKNYPKAYIFREDYYGIRKNISF